MLAAASFNASEDSGELSVRRKFAITPSGLNGRFGRPDVCKISMCGIAVTMSVMNLVGATPSSRTEVSVAVIKSVCMARVSAT